MSLYHSKVGCLSNICSKYADEQNRKKFPKFSKIVFDSSLLAFRGINNLKHIRSFRRKWTLSCVPQACGTFYTTVCVRIRPFWRRKCYGLGWNLSWWSHSAQNYTIYVNLFSLCKKYWASNPCIVSFVD